MTNSDFSFIKEKAYQLTGIYLTDQKKNMIYSRLARRLRVLDLSTFSQYCSFLEINKKTETSIFVNAITTNLTAFFREIHHFEYLKDVLLPELIASNSSTKKLRIWSAGCSTGEEPHSIAMAIKSYAALSTWDVKILATDLDSNVVNHGTKGVYSPERMATIPSEYQKYIVTDENAGVCRLKDDVRSLIRFKVLNLLGDWPMKGPFDFIFCRNVVIYFDAATQAKLFSRYADILKPEGHLIIGHSENLSRVCNRYRSLGKTIYQRDV